MQLSTTFCCIGTVIQTTEIITTLRIITPFSCRRARTQSTKQWLSILEKENIPVLICLTFADKLFAEKMKKDGDCNIEEIKSLVEEELKVCIQFSFFLF